MPASAVNNNPPGNPTSPAVSYEFDCTSTLQAGVAAPFISSAVMNTTADTVLPLGATFGVTGTLTQTLIGPILAGVNQALNPATIGLNVVQTAGSTDGHATGTYLYNHTFASVTNPGGQVTGVTAAAASTTLNGNFSAVPAGAFISGTSISASAVTTAAGTATSITISVPTTAAITTAETVGWAPGAGITFTDSEVSTGPVFTSDGPNGGTAGIGIISATSFTIITPALSIVFGGAPGIGTANCLETGWLNATTPGPAQTNETAPALPFNTVTALVVITPFEPVPFAFVNLVDPTPIPPNQSVSCGVGGTVTVTLFATVAYPPPIFFLPGGGPLTISLPGGGTLIVTQASPGSATVVIQCLALVPTTASFQYNVGDSLPAANGGPVISTTPGTITVNIGSAPTIQPFAETIVGAQLVLSCSSPATYVTGNNTPTPAGTPLLTCPEFQFQNITLDGLEQEVSATTAPTGAAPGTIYVSDNRGSPTDSWTLTGTFVPTAVGTGAGQNSNASCSGVDAFCNSSVGTAALNTATNGAHDGQIGPSYLSVASITCAADSTGGITANGTTYNPPNLNPSATPTTGGNFGAPVNLCAAAAGQSGGTFIYNATYTLVIPESVYAGTYVGSVRYTVA